ncbi:hypothetical protein APS14_14935 [Pseudomonas thivervalensis]|nr:hypothetical protein APS14_14935 [Pseudomonas thivervalensis]
MCFYDPLIAIACVNKKISQVRLKSRMKVNFRLLYTNNAIISNKPFNDYGQHLAYAKSDI